MLVPTSEREWRIEQASPKAGIGEPGALRQVHLENHVLARPERRIQRRHPAHPTTQSGHRKSNALEGALEQHVLLEAIAATATVDELCLHNVEIERDASPEKRVEALKRNRPHVRGVNRAERREIGSHRPQDADAGEV